MFVVSAEEERSKMEPLISLDERKILRRYQGGESAAFEELVLLYRRSVYGYLVRCGVPAHQQEACFQEIFLRVHQTSGSYQGHTAIKPWLFTIVTRVVRAQLRKHRVQKLLRSSKTSAIPQTSTWLEQALGALPLPQREAIALCALEKMSLPDAAVALNTQASALKVNLRKAKLRLAQLRAEAQEAPR